MNFQPYLLSFFGGKRKGWKWLPFAVGAIGPVQASEHAAPHPNIVLIVADDLGYGDLGAYGATKIATPAIDQIAAEGMVFTNAYASSSLCSPSRYSIMTGRYAWRTRLKSRVLKYFEKPLIEKDETTVASMLRRNGYYTAMVGKWHLGFDWSVNEKAPSDFEESVFNSWDENLQEFIDFSRPVRNGPVERGFDYFYGTAGSNNMKPYVYLENDRVLQPPSVEQQEYDHYAKALRAPDWNIEKINSALTHKAVDVIDAHFKTHKQEPLFLYFPTTAIHRPCLPTFTKGKSKAGLRGDIVEELDWTVSRIVEALKRNNAYENTLLIFTSDNGGQPGDPALWIRKYAAGNYEDYRQDCFNDFAPEYVDPHGNKIWKEGWFTYGHSVSGNLLGFKSDAWEGGLKVPFIIRWPGKVNAGAVNTTTMCLADLLATLADIAGDTLSANEGVDSYSFVRNIVDAAAGQARKSLVLTAGASGAFVAIKNSWKYIEAAPAGGWPETYYPDGPSKLDRQLYNLSADQSEQNNLFERHPQKVSEFVSLIERVKTTPKAEGQ